MILEGRFEYKKALILTPERIKELEIILLKYCERVSYEATTIAETEISFESVDELFDYDNFKNRKLKTLTVIGRNKLNRIVTCFFKADSFSFFLGYSETCICKYVVSDVDKETTLKDDVQTLLKKATEPFWLVGKFRLFGLLGVVFLYAFFPIMFILEKSVTGKVTIYSAIIGITISYCLINVIRLFDKCFLEKLFPSIVFLWGEEQTRLKKMIEFEQTFFGV